jgi:hypothetical protein
LIHRGNTTLRDKVRSAIRTLPAEYVRYTLADAVELLPPARLHAVVRQYLETKMTFTEMARAPSRPSCAAAAVIEIATNYSYNR